MTTRFDETIVIEAAPSTVWEVLTDPRTMERWMGEPEMQLEVVTDWIVGQPFVVRGVYHARFENRGTVRAFDPPRRLAYTQLSSLSRLPDEPASYTTIELELTPVERGTSLTVSVHGFPTDSTFRHFRLYWRGTLSILKTFVERR